MPISQNLKSWLISNKMWIKSNSDKEKTHNAMEFGRFLSIKPKFIDKFRKKLAKTLSNGEKNYILEIRTDYFKFMVDVDFKSEYGLNIEEKKILLNLIQRAIIEVVGNKIENNYVIVSSTEDEEMIKDGQKMIKVGFHLIWPNIIVNEDDARFLRSAIIQYLEKSGQRFISLGDWEDIIDSSIYNTHHALRMNGSNKHMKCKECKAKKSLREECSNCNMSGWLDVGRVYRPYLIIEPDNTYNNDLLNELQNDYYKDLVYTSIRTENDKSNISIEERPDWFSENKYTEHCKRKKGKKKYSGSRSVKTNPIKNSRNSDEISEKDPRYIKTKNYLESELFRLSPSFDDIELDKLKKIHFSKSFFYVFTSKSHFCLNMNREHSSNHIYFVINKNTKDVYQKCPSPWTNLDGVRCEEFHSKSLKLPKELYKLLFEENKNVSINCTPIQKKKENKVKSLLYLSLDD